MRGVNFDVVDTKRRIAAVLRENCTLRVEEEKIGLIELQWALVFELRKMFNRVGSFGQGLVDWAQDEKSLQPVASRDVKVFLPRLGYWCVFPRRDLTNPHMMIAPKKNSP